MNIVLKVSFIAALILIFGGTSVETYAQRCGGDFRYFLRDEKGALVAGETIHLKYFRENRTGNDSVTPGEDRLVSTDHMTRYPVAGNVMQPDASTQFVRVFWAGTGCGVKFMEAALEHENQIMVLRFHNLPGEANFFIDSLPFQEGTFEIDFKSDMTLKNQKLNREGLKSKEGEYFLRTTAEFGILVSAENWVKTTQKTRL